MITPFKDNGNLAQIVPWDQLFRLVLFFHRQLIGQVGEYSPACGSR